MAAKKKEIIQYVKDEAHFMSLIDTENKKLVCNYILEYSNGCSPCMVRSLRNDVSYIQISSNKYR
jgi:hypothetical protein